MGRLLVLVLAMLLVLPAAAAAAEPALELPAGNGTTLRVDRAPFRVALVDHTGRETVATVAGSEGLPVRAPGIDGPQPLEPLGSAGGYPAMAFVLGARAGSTFPVSFFQGNRLFGVEAGGLVALSEVTAVRPRGDGADLEVATTASGQAATLAVRRLDGGGVRLALRPPEGLPAVSTLVSLVSPGGEGLYGLGARKDAFDQRGRLRNVWVEQQNATSEEGEQISSADPTGTLGPEYTFPNGAQAAYYVQSALFGSRGWGAWVDEPALHRLDLAASRGDRVRWGVASPVMTLNLAGGGLEEASRAFTSATGRPAAPPPYVYEPWIDVLNEGEGEAAPNGAGFAGGERVKRDLDEIARMSEQLDIPIGVLGVEGWHKVLDEEGPQARAYFRGLRERGFRLSAYWNPFTAEGTRAYDEALRRDLFVETPSGEPYPIVTNRGNRSYLIDFTAPGAYDFWKEQLDRSAELGFEAFMHDFGEQITEGMRQADGVPPQLAHNAYPVHYHGAARAALDRQRDERGDFAPWFYVRAGFTGVTRDTGGVFPGDETTDWSRGSGIPSVVPAMLNLALGGANTFTTDVGGYLDLVSPRTTPELLTRWSQLAALTPVSRIHNSTGGGTLLPWDAGEAALDAYRRYARLKMRLVELNDRWSRRAARDGTIGPVRPLVLEDPGAVSVRDEWLLGADLLAAPVLEEGARSREVYLPAGSAWQRVVVDDAGRLRPAGGVEAGGRTVRAPAPLADIPLFRRVVERSVRVRCASRGRVRVALRGDDRGVLGLDLRAGARRLSDARAPFGRTFRAPARATKVRALVRHEDGTVRRLATALPARC